MNKYEAFASNLGFTLCRQGKTRASERDLVGLTFEDFDAAKMRKVCGRPTNHKPDLFFYRLGASRAILVDTQRNRILLANSKRAVAAFLRTVNS